MAKSAPTPTPSSPTISTSARSAEKNIGGQSVSWTPIGSISRPYSGTFNGAGHTISGLYINDSTYQGLFGYVDTGGTVQDLSVSGSVSGSYNVGGVVGYNRGSVEDCDFTGSVSGNNYVGGVVGWNASGTVKNCYNTGAVNSSGIYVGGVAGYNSGTVENCYNTGTVSDGITSGGVVGQNSGSVTRCYFLKDTAGSGIGNEGSAAGAAVVDNLTDQDQFKGWDFTDIWRISQSQHRPVLQANAEDNALSGTGKQEDPYKIYRAIDLKNFRDLVNGGEKSAHAKLMNDIDLNGNEKNQWTRIGNSESTAYTGTFNGQNFKISGLTINDSTADYQGLFGYVGSSGIVQNLTVSGTVIGRMKVGGIAGQNGGRITDCAFSGSVSGNSPVGGVVGSNSFSATVTNCYNTGTVTGTSKWVGGVVGLNSDGNVENCYNIGDVSGGEDVGGVVGYNSSIVVDNNSGTVKNCYNTGTVSDGTTSGGVVGQNSGSVTNCYFLQQNGVPAQGIGSGSGTSSNVEARTAAAFHSGEVAWRLQNGQTAGAGEPIPLVWGQSNLTTDKSWPTLVALDKNAKTVYQVTLKYDHAGEQDKTYYTDDTATPSEQPSRDGYTFDHWDKTEGEGNTITYTAKWIEATPEPTPDPEPEEPPYTGKYSYELSTSVGDHGSLTVDRYATEGDKVTIEVAPDQAYKLDDLSVTANGKDVELTANSDGTYTFTMPSADVRITATFAKDPDWTEPEEPATDVSDLFLDIAPDAWYKDAIQYAYDNGLMTGVSATEFAPEATTTRAMIVSILARLEGVTTAQAAGFADVDDNDWYATAVNWAANVGVVNGYEDGTFKPNTAITREQLAAILMNYAAYKGYDVSARADLSHYSDADSISSWANDVLLWAVAEGLLTGVTDDTIAPQAHATRAQVAAILQRFLSE